MESLGFIINSNLMSIYQTQEKSEKIIILYEKLLKTEQVTINEMASLIGLLTSTYQAK